MGQVGSPFGEKGYRYLYAVHTHQSATHGHVLLCLSNGRKRLRFKKPQLIMLRQHQVEVAKEFGWEMQATRFQDRDFSLTGFIAPTKKKTLLERQVPQWYAQRQAEKQHSIQAVRYDIGEQAQQILSAWSKSFSNPACAEQLFIEMYAEKPKTALWYANHRLFFCVRKTRRAYVSIHTDEKKRAFTTNDRLICIYQNS